eukprot:1592163-Rhodomonas_salina.1
MDSSKVVLWGELGGRNAPAQKQKPHLHWNGHHPANEGQATYPFETVVVAEKGIPANFSKQGYRHIGDVSSIMHEGKEVLLTSLEEPTFTKPLVCQDSPPSPPPTFSPPSLPPAPPEPAAQRSLSLPSSSGGVPRLGHQHSGSCSMGGGGLGNPNQEGREEGKPEGREEGSRESEGESEGE